MIGARKRTRSSAAKESQSKRLKDVDVNAVKVKLEEMNELKNETDLAPSLSSDEPKDEFSGVSEYEKRRLKNLKENAEFFANLGILKAKQELHSISEKPKKPKPSIFSSKKKKVVDVLPRRSSLRIKRVDPEGVPLPELPPQLAFEDVDSHPRKPDPLPIKDSLIIEVEDEKLSSFMSSFQKLSKEKQTVSSGKSVPAESFAKTTSALHLSESQVEKVVKNRIFSLAIHPCASKVLLCAGDKWGQLGFWDLDKGEVFVFEPHSRPINCVMYSPGDERLLYTASYDSTVKRMDINTSQFMEVFETDQDYDVRATHFDFLSSDSMVISQSDGALVIKDLRSELKTADSFHQVSSRVLKTVHSHPVDRQYVVTAANDGLMSVWDLRYMRKISSNCVDSVNHTKSVSSAYFSPITGQYILSANLANRINIHSFSGGSLSKEASFSHDNHVGRWLTGFRPTWHPSREDIFISGSMSRPRQIELYSRAGHILERLRSDNLNSVCSLNVYHPTRNILAGANSSGRLHVFM